MFKEQPEYTLFINHGTRDVGTLVLDKNTNLLKLEYTDDWQQSGFPISPALSLDNQHTPEVAYNYLDNALPEGEARKLLAHELGVSEKNVYSQVRSIGDDLTGAISFTATEPQSNSAPRATEPQLRIIKPEELSERLSQKDDIGLVLWDDKPRLSVAGVQDKLNVFINEQGQMGFGDGSLYSTHILKFEKANCPNLVLNEYFCMKLSEAAGLPTAKIQFTRFNQHPALIVERFDRKHVADETKVFRRHIIDGCQALNLPRDYKYERNLGDGRDVQHIRDGASLPMLFELAKITASPVESMLWLIQWQSFNLMISNYDSHGKNVSLFFDKSNKCFTPAYDLVNVAMFPQFKHTLAMAMGDEFEPNNIHAYQLADFAETCGINKKFLSRQLSTLANKVMEILTKHDFINQITQGKQFTNDDRQYLTKVKAQVFARTRYLHSQSSEIQAVEV